MPASETFEPELRDVSIVGIVAQSRVLLGEDFDMTGVEAPGVELQMLNFESAELPGFGVKLEISHLTPDMRIGIEAVATYAGSPPDISSDELARFMDETAIPALFPFVYEAFRATAARLPGEQPSIPATRPRFSFNSNAEA